MLEVLRDELSKAGLSLNDSKTKILTTVPEYAVADIPT